MQHDNDNDIPNIDVNLDDQPTPNKFHSNSPRFKKQSKRRPLKIILIIVISVVILGGAGFAVYWFGMREDAAPQTQTTGQDNSAGTQDQTPVMDPAEASKISTFKSETLNLEFDHRGDWTVEESEDGNSLTITSPDISYQTIKGTVPDGRGVFTLRIAKGVNSAQRDAINNATAVEKSFVTAYAKPTEAQRHYTSISYGGTEDAFTFLMVTGSVEFAKGDPWAGKLTVSSADYYLIAGGFGEDPDNALAFDQVSPSQINSETVKQATAIIESLRLF